MLDALARHARRTPQKTAVIDQRSGARYCYRELADLTSRYEGVLSHPRLGLKGGDRIAVLSPPNSKAMLLFFAAIRLNTPLVPLNHRLAIPELAAVLADANPNILLYGPEFAETASRLREARPRLRAYPIDALHREARSAEAKRRPEFKTDPEDIALILYTSGTTGIPKGAMLSRRMLLANARQTCRGWGLDSADRSVNYAPFFHTGGWNVLSLPLLYAGGTLTLLEKFDPALIGRLAAEGEATVLFGVPTTLQTLLETLGPHPRTALSNTRFVISGGAPCPEPVIRAYRSFGVNFRQGFGMTEVGPNCFMFPGEEVDRKRGSVGIPMPGTEAKLLSPDGKESDGGELWLRGSHVFSGYLNRSEETERTLQDGWVKTGDLAERDADGFYRILGRLKEMYISGGENVYPIEVEKTLLSYPAVAEAAVVGVPDPKWGESGRAFVVARPGSELSAAELIGFCRDRLAGYKIPKNVRLLDSLPKNAVGKIQKRELQALR